MNNTVRHLCALLLLCLAAWSCEHKDLCYHHPHDARVRIDVDWSRFTVEQPTGMTVILYEQDGRADRLTTQHTNDISKAVFTLPAGWYRSIVYNQSESEFGTLMFRGMDNYHTAEVYAKPTNSRWYVTRGDKTRVVTEPEWLGTSRNQDMEVTDEMVEQTFVERMNANTKVATRSQFLIGTHMAENIIYTVNVKVHISGIHNLRSARASLSGLAEGYLMGQGRPNAGKVVQLLEEWKIWQDVQDPTQGTIDAKITCFGLPYGHMGQAEENLFELEVLLVDNKTKLKYPFHVGDKFQRNIDEHVQLSLWLDLTLGSPLPDVQPEGGGSGGFSAEVDDWGPEENIDIQM